MGVRVGLLTDMVTCSIETMTMLLTEPIQVRAKWVFYHTGVSSVWRKLPLRREPKWRKLSVVESNPIYWVLRLKGNAK